MNAKLLGLFSGFPSRSFPENIAEVLKRELTVRKLLTFVSAWPQDAQRNDADAAGMHGMFEACDLAFENFAVIDNRSEAEEAKRLIQRASCVFLMGGSATEQIQLIREKGIYEVLREYTGILLGVSAGSSNMAVHALDIWESHVPYNGLGLVNLTVKAHVSDESVELLDTLKKISLEHGLPVCAMEDESAIFVRSGEVTTLGTLRWVTDGRVYPFSAEVLKQ